jgi:integrase
MSPITVANGLSPTAVASYIRAAHWEHEAMATRKTDFIFQRPGSDNWWIKLRSGGQRVEKSLRTSDRARAEILALPMIAEHKARLLAARPRFEPIWQQKLKPGLHVSPDGSRIFATERELHHLDAQGVTTSTTPNGGPAFQIVNLEHRLGIPFPVPIEVTDKVRPTLAVKSADDAIIETYLKHANITGHFEREVRTAWALYKQLTDSKLLKDADRDDGRKLVEYFRGRNLKSATVRKKIMWLTAAVNLAIKEGRLKFNPFSSIVPERDDKLTRLPLDAADMKAIKSGLDRLDAGDQVLFRFLACTGMRLSEAFEIDSEATERGVRYVVTGHKTEASLRRVPLPAGVLPYLPKKIAGPLFAGPAASKRLNRFLDAVGIVDPAKTLHSLRHRAKDRLRSAGCPLDVQYELLGHETKTIASGYGHGSPVPLLKKWIDKIGF